MKCDVRLQGSRNANPNKVGHKSNSAYLRNRPDHDNRPNNCAKDQVDIYHCQYVIAQAELQGRKYRIKEQIYPKWQGHT